MGGHGNEARWKPPCHLSVSLMAAAPKTQPHGPLGSPFSSSPLLCARSSSPPNATAWCRSTGHRLQSRAWSYPLSHRAKRALGQLPHARPHGTRCRCSMSCTLTPQTAARNIATQTTPSCTWRTAWTLVSDSRFVLTPQMRAMQRLKCVTWPAGHACSTCLKATYSLCSPPFNGIVMTCEDIIRSVESQRCLLQDSEVQMLKGLGEFV
mmetsp:Transcript_104040/g.303732  ORF Transcript_104040/g.303732 Transcript_104040/m.303732 type:complete len:208 (-) Transcript_104040:218-841(-)